MALPKIDQGFCERLVTTAVNHCAAPPAPIIQPAAQTAATPNFDGLAASFGALSVALTIGTIVIGILGVVAAFAWGHSIKNMAEREAKAEAERCAKAHVDTYMNKWLATEAPQIVRTHVEFLRNTSLGDDDDEQAADDIGTAAG